MDNSYRKTPDLIILYDSSPIISEAIGNVRPIALEE